MKQIQLNYEITTFKEFRLRKKNRYGQSKWLKKPKGTYTVTSVYTTSDKDAILKMPNTTC
jgi:hypothetical protein